MTDKEKAQKPVDEKVVNSTPAVTESKKTSDEPPGVKKQKSNGLWLAVIACLLAILALAASGYLWHSGQQQTKDVLLELGGAQKLIDSQQQQLQTLQRELSNQAAAMSQQQQSNQSLLKTVQAQLRSQQQRLISLSTTDREDWLLAEVEYLIRLAEQRVLTAGDAVSATGLLDAADKILHELDDSALYPVRKTLAENKTALQMAAKLDLDGLYLQLEALAGQVDDLQLFTKPMLQVEQAETPAQNQNWRERLEQGAVTAWEKLGQYIQIHRRDDIYKPALAPEHEAALRQNVRLMFEQAQMALLSGNDNLYQRSLSKAQQWLEDFYTLNSEATQRVVETIETLKQRSVKAELPDISSSRRELKTFIETLHELSTESSDVVSEEETAQ